MPHFSVLIALLATSGDVVHDVSNTSELRAALARVRPGETVRLAPGRYQGGTTRDGLHGGPDRPIVIRGANPKDPPVIEGGASGFHLSRVAHVELRDLVLTGATANGLNIDDGGAVGSPSHHVVLSGLVVRDVGPTGNRDGIKLSGVDDFRVEDCVIERWGSGGSGIDMVGCHLGEVVRCVFRHGDTTGDHGLQAKGGSAEIVVRRCRFEHAGQRAVNIGGSTGLAFFRPKVEHFEARDIRVEDCTFTGSLAAVAFVGVDGATFQHNTIYRPRKWAFRILQENRSPGFVPSRGGHFTDNVVVFRSDEMTMPINVGDATDPASFKVARNAWYCQDAPNRSRPRMPIAEEAGTYGKDPRLVDPERGDLSLPPDSPVRPAGPRERDEERTAARPRLVVLTDISSLTAGVAEPDDGQSLVRLMLHANEFDLEGLIATSNLVHGQTTRPDLVHRVVDAYERARPNLLLHDSRYPPADALRQVIRAGQPVAGPKVTVTDSIGPGKDTPASRWIIAVVDRPDPRPVWVLVWGGTADLAQALDTVRRERSTEAVARFMAKLRVHAIGDQDATGPWVREQFPDLYLITQRRAYRGMYRAGDVDLVGPDWVEAHVRGHGPLGDLYPNYRGGDIWSGTLGPVRGVKEGDTPSFLTLVPNGLFDEDQPWLGSWGGRFAGVGAQRADVADEDLDTTGDPDPRMASVYRWRAAFQADFAARLDWCVQPFDRANHPPIVRVQGTRTRRVVSGNELVLDASATTDPDGDPLEFDWCVYPSDRETAGAVRIDGAKTARPRLVIGDASRGQVVPVLLTVKDAGRPALSRHGRVLLQVSAEE